MELGIREKYRKERGWSGRVYYVRMSEAEVRARERVKLAFGILFGMPMMIFIMAMAAGLI